jgi:hypothetical protein
MAFQATTPFDGFIIKPAWSVVWAAGTHSLLGQAWSVTSAAGDTRFPLALKLHLTHGLFYRDYVIFFWCLSPLFPLHLTLSTPLSSLHFQLSTFNSQLFTLYSPLSTFHSPLSTLHSLLSTFHYPLSTFFFTFSSNACVEIQFEAVTSEWGSVYSVDSTRTMQPKIRRR